MENSVAEIVKERREALGLSQHDLARMVGTSQATIDKIENNRSRASKFLPVIWEQLQLDEEQLKSILRKLLFQPGAARSEEALLRGFSRTSENAPDAMITGTSPDGTKVTRLIEMKRYQPDPVPREGLVGAVDLPIYVSVRAGAIDDSVMVSPEPIDYVKRPEPLARAKNGYGLYIVGDSMEPAFRQGDLALVHPNAPAKPGDEVVVCSTDVDGEHYAVIKLLTKVTADKWHLKQYNPGPGEPAEFTLDRREWPVCHLVVGSYRRR